MLEREFQKKRRLRSIIYSKITVLVLLLVAIFLVGPTWRVYKTKAETRRNIDKLSLELKTLRQKESVLMADTERLSTPKGTEEEIRKKFNVSKEGEDVVFVVGQKEEKVPPKVEPTILEKIKSFFTGFFD